VISDSKMGRALKRARKERGLTQAQLALEADVSIESILNYEGGKLPRRDSDAFDRVLAALDPGGDINKRLKTENLLVAVREHADAMDDPELARLSLMYIEAVEAHYNEEMEYADRG
jgi:transcriptional regulator with XRE-family HTH domain